MTRRNLWFAVRMAVLTLVGALTAGGAAYWNFANQLPPYDAPPVVLPVPNAYDDYLAAAAISQAAGGTGPTLQDRVHDVPPGRLSTVVARNRAALARLRQGFGKQSGAPPVVSREQLFPEKGGFRELARVLVAEGKLAEREGRMADAARSYRDCLRFGVDVPRGGTLLHGQLGIAIQNTGLRALEESIHRLAGPTAARLAREMRSLDGRSTSFAQNLAIEKDATTLCLREALRHTTVWQALIPSCSLSPGDSPILHGYLTLQYGLVSKRSLLNRYRSYLDAGIVDAPRPYYATALPTPDRVLQFVTPEISEFKVKWAVRDARWRIMQLRLAARAYQYRHGAPPPSVEALVPAYLPAIPQDPFANRPLVYRVKANRALIYSRGPDSKDDGGKDLGESVYASTTGDIVTLKPRQPLRSPTPGTPPGGPPPHPTR